MYSPIEYCLDDSTFQMLTITCEKTALNGVKVSASTGGISHVKTFVGYVQGFQTTSPAETIPRRSRVALIDLRGSMTATPRNGLGRNPDHPHTHCWVGL